MSYHSMQYLNSGKILVGNVAKTGHAWWYDQKLEDPNNPTHFDNFIPLELVKEKLFGWEALESTHLIATFQVPIKDDDGHYALDDNGNQIFKEIQVPVTDYKALGRADWVEFGVPEDEESGANAILSVTSDTYSPHQLKKTFIDNTQKIIGDQNQLGVKSAGLLKWGRRGWITVELPEHIINDASGMEFRSMLTVSTSFDQSLPTSYTRTAGIPVCDNTLDWELMKAGDTGKFVIRHTKNSGAKIKDATEALGLLVQDAENYDNWLTAEVNIEVSDSAFKKWLNKMVPIPEAKTKVVKIKSIQGEVEVEKVSTNGITIAMNKRDKLIDMYTNDPRVTPWMGTKLGIIQLWNTFQQHESTIKGVKAAEGNKVAARVESNMMKMLSGKFLQEDKRAIEELDEILSEEFSTASVAPKGDGGVAVAEAPTKTTTKVRRPRGSASSN